MFNRLNCLIIFYNMFVVAEDISRNITLRNCWLNLILIITINY